MRIVFVLLLGYAGSGQLTIARALAPTVDARIVDKHWINNPILSLLGTNGATPNPSVWDQISKVREAVMETIAGYSPPGLSFIFTYCASRKMRATIAAMGSCDHSPSGVAPCSSPCGFCARKLSSSGASLCQGVASG